MELETLIKTYPDALFIQTHREPTKFMGSWNSLVERLRSFSSEPCPPHEPGAEQLVFMSGMLDRAVDFRLAHPELEHRWMDVNYFDLVEDPFGVVRRIYQHFGWTLEQEAVDAMEEWQFLQAEKRRTETRHRYALEDYGLTPETVNAAFKRYRDFITSRGIRTSRSDSGLPEPFEVEFGFSTSCLSAPKLTAESFDPSPVRAEVINAEPRRRTNVDHAALGAETAFELIDETDPGPAGRVEVILRGRDDDGAGRRSHEVFQSGESQDGITRQAERLDSMKTHRVVPTADAIEQITRTGRKLFGHESSSLKGTFECAVLRRWCDILCYVEIQGRVTSPTSLHSGHSKS